VVGSSIRSLVSSHGRKIACSAAPVTTAAAVRAAIVAENRARHSLDPSCWYAFRISVLPLLRRVSMGCRPRKVWRLDLVRERIADGITLRRFTDRALDLRVADLASVALPAELGHGSEWQSAAFPSRSWVASASTSYIAAT
jgi:hypothetical protein